MFGGAGKKSRKPRLEVKRMKRLLNLLLPVWKMNVE